MNTYKPLIKVELIFTKRNLFTVMMTVGIQTDNNITIADTESAAIAYICKANNV